MIGHIIEFPMTRNIFRPLCYSMYENKHFLNSKWQRSKWRLIDKRVPSPFFAAGVVSSYFSVQTNNCVLWNLGDDTKQNIYNRVHTKTLSQLKLQAVTIIFRLGKRRHLQGWRNELLGLGAWKIKDQNPSDLQDHHMLFDRKLLDPDGNPQKSPK